jgi:hypothetical protein
MARLLQDLDLALRVAPPDRHRETMPQPTPAKHPPNLHSGAQLIKNEHLPLINRGELLTSRVARDHRIVNLTPQVFFEEQHRSAEHGTLGQVQVDLESLVQGLDTVEAAPRRPQACHHILLTGAATGPCCLTATFIDLSTGSYPTGS